jgi:signal transduction histidine kinase
MRETAAKVGGSLDIESMPGMGTTVEVAVGLSKKVNGRAS